MKSNLKKGIKGQMIIPLNDDSIKYINENIEVFKAVCDRDFECCEFEIFEGEFKEKDVVGINFNILDKTVKEADISFNRFKKEIKNHFGFKPEEIFIGKYDKI